jgi:hypothetical protein
MIDLNSFFFFFFFLNNEKSLFSILEVRVYLSSNEYPGVYFTRMRIYYEYIKKGPAKQK